MAAGLSTIFVALVLALVVIGFASVQAGFSATSQRYNGWVTSYDPSTKVLGVYGGQGEKTFDVSKAARNRPLQADESVRVWYTDRNGQMVATSIDAADNYMGARIGTGEKG